MLAACLIAACSDEAPPVEEPGPAPATLPGVYRGEFPCSNCPGILATLWLRDDGRFFFEQKYRPDANETGTPTAAYALGRWQWRADERVLALQGAGPQRLFDRPGKDLLLMHTGAVEEHRLERDPAGAPFVAAVSMRGIVSRRGEQIVFAECLTGLEAPIEKAGDYSRFLRQFRSIGGGPGAVTAELKGRFGWSIDGSPASLFIDKLIALRADSGCAKAA